MSRGKRQVIIGIGVFLYWFFILATVVAFSIDMTPVVPKRPSLVIFTADWCGNCRRLEKALKSDTKLISYTKNHIDDIWYIDVDTNSGRKLFKTYNMSNSIPAIAVGYVDDNNEIDIVDRFYGYSSVSSFVNIVNESL